MKVEQLRGVVIEGAHPFTQVDYMPTLVTGDRSTSPVPTEQGAGMHDELQQLIAARAHRHHVPRRGVMSGVVRLLRIGAPRRERSIEDNLDRAFDRIGRARASVNDPDRYERRR